MLGKQRYRKDLTKAALRRASAIIRSEKPLPPRKGTKAAKKSDFLAAFVPFLGGKGFSERIMADARRSAALVKSLRYLCFPSMDLIFGRPPRAPDFIVTDARFFAGRFPLPCLTVKTKPFSLLTIPTYRCEFLLVRLSGSVLNGFGQPRFF